MLRLAYPGTRPERLASAVLIAMMTLALVAAPTLGQGPSPNTVPPLDRVALEATCHANATTPEDLETCLDIVARVLAPAQEAAPPSQPVAGALPFEPFTIKGKGDKVVRIDVPADAPAIAKFSHKGKSNFSVVTLADDGGNIDLLVNEIGNYKGTVLFDEDPDDHAVAFEISADGKWDATVSPVQSARTWDTSSELKGKGDDVVRLTSPITGFATFSLSHRGKSNIVVIAHTTDGSADLLVNEIGRYEGEVLLPDGTALLEVTADGNWTGSPIQG